MLSIMIQLICKIKSCKQEKTTTMWAQWESQMKNLKVKKKITKSFHKEWNVNTTKQNWSFILASSSWFSSGNFGASLKKKKKNHTVIPQNARATTIKQSMPTVDKADTNFLDWIHNANSGAQQWRKAPN